MIHVLVVCNTDTTSDPRPNRMIHCLQNNCQVSVVAKNADRDTVATFYHLDSPPSSSFGRIQKATWLKLRRFDRYLWPPVLSKLAEQLEQKTFDAIVVHDLALLPFVFKIRKSAKVLFDAREYYPREYEDQLTWRFLFKDLNHYLCKRYMPECDQVITVSQGLADEYRREYGVLPQVVFSLPFYHDITPSPVSDKPIRIIHHGAVAPSRRIEKMIQMVDYLDDRFALDLMLVASEQDSYFQFLKQEASKRTRVRIIPPVRHSEIIPFTNQYDIGLFYLEAANFSLAHAMPNKLFEFIQARLMVAVTPTEMSKVVDQYACGIVAPSFDIQAFAKQFNSLSAEQIRNYKQQSHVAAQTLNAHTTCEQVRAIVQQLSANAP